MGEALFYFACLKKHCYCLNLPKLYQKPKKWEKRSSTLTSSSSVTSTLASRLRPAISSTNAVVSTSVSSKSSKRKPKRWAKAPSNMPGFWTSSRLSVNVVSPSTLLCGSSKLRTTTSPSSTPPEPVNLKPVSPRTAKPVSMLFSPTPWACSSSLLVSTKWTPPLPTLMTRPDSWRSERKSKVTSRRSDTTLRKSSSAPSLDGTEITCWRNLRR